MGKSFFCLIIMGLVIGCSAPPVVPPAAAPQAAPAATKTPASGPVVRYGVMTYVDGDVKVQSGGKWTDADVGLKVDQSSVVKTGRGAVCDLQFGRLGTLHLSENTVVALTTVGLGEVAKAVDLEVVSGTLTAKVSKLLADQRFHVRTDTVVAGVRGTRFLVSRTGAKTSVAVAEGLVALVPPADSDAVQGALDTAPSVGPGREALVSRAGEEPVVRPVGDENRKTLEQTASMSILDSLPIERPSSPGGDPKAFGAPRLEAPADGTVLDRAKTPSVVLKWNPVTGAGAYEVSVSVVESGQSRSLMSWTTPGETIEVGLAGQLGPGAYLWQVTAIRNNLNFTEDRSPPSQRRFTLK